MDFNFLKQTLNEKRKYRLHRYPYYEVIEDELVSDAVTILDNSNDNSIDVEISNVLFDNNEPMTSEEEKFFAELPEDFCSFYKLYNGGFLFYKNFYRLLSRSEILEVEAFFMERDKEEGECKVIRFCDMQDGIYIALRKKINGEWGVVWADPGDSNYELCSGDNDKYCLMDKSFSEWLKRMIITDGWPMSCPEGAQLVDDEELMAGRI
jgi:hypothetical protein